MNRKKLRLTFSTTELHNNCRPLAEINKLSMGHSMEQHIMKFLCALPYLERYFTLDTFRAQRNP